MKKLVLFLADGFEEIEAVTVIDVLRRAELELITVSINSEPLARGAHGINVETDFTLANLAEKDFEMLIFPGGARGVQNLKDNKRIQELIAANSDGQLAAICAAPSLLAAGGWLEGRRATSYPSFADQVKAGSTIYSEETVVIDNNITTSRGPGTAMAFALALVEKLKDRASSERLAQQMLVSL